LAEHKKIATKQIKIRDVKIGGDAPISVQSMTFSKTKDVKGTLEQIQRLYFAGCDIVRCAVFDKEDTAALREVVKASPLPVVADIHFNHNYAVIVSEFVDAIRINPGNIGSKKNIKAVVDACKQRNLPIRIGVNSGSLEKQFEDRYGRTVEAMVQSALYNINLLEDFDFTDIKISLKSSDVERTMAPAASRRLSRAAREALDAEGPIVDDGLDTSSRLDVEHGPSDGVASEGSVLPTRSRALIESDLSRVLRTVISEPARRDLTEDPLSVPALSRLDRACSRLVLARRFHNTHVSEAQALRGQLLVRVFHLAGRAPMPQTFDADDDTTPEVQPAPYDQAQQR